MKLFIIRHGEASAPGPGAEQALTDHGRQQALRRAQSLADETISVLIHSPKLRTTQTATILHEQGVGGTLLEDQRLLPGAKVEQVEELLAQHNSSGSIALVSHLPLVAHLAGWFSAGQIDAQEFGYFAPVGMVVLEMDTLARGCAELLSMDFHND